MKGLSYKNIPPIEYGGVTYTALDNIGNGGAGCVFKMQSVDGKALALKVLAPNSPSEKTERFKREFDFLHNCSQKGFVKALEWKEFDLTVDDERSPKTKLHCLSYLMPLYDGSFRDVLKSSRAPSAKLHILLTTVSALSFLHQEGIVHRDLKPENLLFDKSKSKLYLADFGIAKFPTSTLTKNGDRLLNNVYFAPEQRKGSKISVGPYTDIYAFGLMINECFTGVVPQGINYRTIGSVDPRYAFLDRIVELMTQNNISARERDISHVRDEIKSEEEKLSFLRQMVRAHFSKGAEANSKHVKILSQATGDLFINCYVFSKPGLQNNFNSNYHSNVLYRFNGKYWPEFVVRSVFDACKRKLDYELGADLDGWEGAAGYSYCSRETLKELMDILTPYKNDSLSQYFPKIALMLTKLYDYHAEEIVKFVETILKELPELSGGCSLYYLLGKLGVLLPSGCDFLTLVRSFYKYVDIDFDGSSSYVPKDVSYLLDQHSNLAIFLRTQKKLLDLFPGSVYRKKSESDARYCLYFNKISDAKRFQKICLSYASTFEPGDVRITDVDDMLSYVPFDGKENKSFEFDEYAAIRLLPKILSVSNEPSMDAMPDETLFLMENEKL